jgi:hypothetical protein
MHPKGITTGKPRWIPENSILRKQLGEGSNGDDDGSLRHWLGFYCVGKFHAQSKWQRGRLINGLKGESK